MTKQELDGLLFAIVGSTTLVKKWWNSPNQAFDLQKPVDVYKETPEKVEQYILSFIKR
jgi:hypothetical protein